MTGPPNKHFSYYCNPSVIILKELFNITIKHPVDSGQKHLSICVGIDHCSFAVTSDTKNKLYRLGYYTHEVIDADFLEELFSVRAWPGINFERVNIHFDTPQSLLIPLKYHNHENKVNLLHLMNGLSVENIIFSDPVPGWQLYNVYSSRKDVSDYLTFRFPSAKFSHVYSTLLKTVKLNNHEGSLVLDFKERAFSVIVFKENKILLTQTFNYYNAGDIIYHLLNICNHFSLLQSVIELQISGLVEDQSALFKELSNYFSHINFRTARDWGIINTGANKYPAHYFASLNELAGCAS